MFSCLLLLVSVTFGLYSSPFAATAMAIPSDRFAAMSVFAKDRIGETRSRRSGSDSVVIISGNDTISSENRTFEFGFFNTNGESKWFLGVWYASIPAPTYVWVGNREAPVKNLTSAKVVIGADGRLTVRDSGDEMMWRTENIEKAARAKLLEEGNLVLLADNGKVVWQSFDHPTDTWLPGMNITSRQWLTCWRSSTDPSPGRYSLRLKPPDYAEIELTLNGNETYWSSGKWTGNYFAGVPEMTVRYIYKFHFVDPFTPAASFGFTETSLERGTRPPLTRFQLHFSGQLRQFTWSSQTENWSHFWVQPENPCKVYGICGNLGLCNAKATNQDTNFCKCLADLQPVDGVGWDSGDFSGGCRRRNNDSCGSDDGFEEVGGVSFDGAITESFPGNRITCERTCLNNCSCVGLHHNARTNLCKLYGSLMNLQNSTSDSTIQDILRLRVPKGGIKKEKNKKTTVLMVSIGGFLSIWALVAAALLIARKRRAERRKAEEEAVFAVRNLKLFSYKELNAATRGFSEKLGHGGFGTVFLGEISDSSLVAVKRLERPGGGEREFRAEVCTIGNIQHVNLVRLRGFCSENSHRLLVYDYMPNGSLSVYLKRNGQSLSWDVRFRVAIGTARGIAYLHEECRDCIIHCDIKPENILLDENFSAKVSDFGLAKLIGRDFSRVLATMRGTWGYVAPEWISGVAISSKADVYSYGMTLLELIGGRRNVEGPPSAGEGGAGEKWFFPPWAAKQIVEGNVGAVVDDRLGGVYDAAEAERMGLVAVWCIQDEEGMRPTMGMVVKMLEGVVGVGVPPQPKLLQALVSGDSFHGVATDSGNRVSGDGGDASSEENIQLSGDLGIVKPLP